MSMISLCSWMERNFTPTFCIDITDTFDQKMESVACYKSQFVGASGAVPDNVRAVAAYFGTRIGTKYAEPFFTHEVLGFGGLDQLI